MTRPTVAEIVNFRLNPSTDVASFIQAADMMTAFLRSTGAMTSRALSMDDDGRWTDHIVWTSLEAAQCAAQELFSRAEAQPFMQMIAPDDVKMRYATLSLYLPPE